MRTELNRMGYDQIPQLTSSRFIEVEKPMYIVPPTSEGRRRAILIGINYTGQQGQLSGTCYCCCRRLMRLWVAWTTEVFFGISVH
jgi:hypothetical protein